MAVSYSFLPFPLDFEYVIANSITRIINFVSTSVPEIFSNCLTVNKNTGSTDWIPSNTQLLTVCFNSVMRRVLLFEDASLQVKSTPPLVPSKGEYCTFASFFFFAQLHFLTWYLNLAPSIT